MYSKHPKKADRGIAQHYLAQSVAAGAAIAEIERMHALYCEIEWSAMESRFVPKLSQWLLDQGWKYPPKAKKSKEAENPWDNIE